MFTAFCFSSRLVLACHGISSLFCCKGVPASVWESEDRSSHNRTDAPLFLSQPSPPAVMFTPLHSLIVMFTLPFCKVKLRKELLSQTSPSPPTCPRCLPFPLVWISCASDFSSLSKRLSWPGSSTLQFIFRTPRAVSPSSPSITVLYCKQGTTLLYCAAPCRLHY